MRLNNWAFCKILPFAILVWAPFWQNYWLKKYYLPSSIVQMQKLPSTIMWNMNMSKLHNSWWWSMTVHNYLCSNMCDSWNHQLSWLFEWAFRNKIFVANVFGGSCKIKSFYKSLVSSFKSTSTDGICLCFLLGTLMGVHLLESLICHPPYGEDTVNLSCWEIIS